MGIVRACASVAAVMLCVSLVACSSTPPAEPASAPASSASPAPPAATADPKPGATDQPADPDAEQPIAKVVRPGTTTKPKHAAEPASTTDPVTYPDGVSVQIVDVSFAEETAQGPGSFPGRDYARLTLELTNDSAAGIDLGTSVLTVLDESAEAVPRVYAAEADTRDFSGMLEPGGTATAVYAFAVPADSRSQITLVVDFDAIHTSAVFRGGLS